MNVGGLGSLPFMQGVRNTTPGMATGGVTAREQADNSMAGKMLPMQVAENAARAATEAKGLFVDTYA